MILKFPFQVLSLRDLEMTAQVLLALVLAGAIGYERERRRKPAGLRTHMLVGAGTTAFTLASISGFGAGLGADPSRVAAQIVSGIGFLGAGTIFRSGSEVRGLTTAATIWMVAALGMLVVVRMYWLAILTTLPSVLVLHFLNSLPRERRHARIGEPSPMEDEDDD